ncbi:hypothetical protein D9M73_124410 [compost metagenome]
MPATADQRQDPARIGILPSADVHAEPFDVVKALAVMLLAGLALVRTTLLDHLLGRGHPRAIAAHQSGGDVLRALLLEQLLRQCAIVLVDFDVFHQHRHQPRLVGLADVVDGRRIHPFDRDPRAAQHHLDAALALIRHDQDRGALLARAAGAARTVLQRLGIARQFDVNDEAERRQIEPARGNVGRHAHPRALVAQRLHRGIALILAMLARQRDRGEPALDQPGVQMPHIVARRAEQDRGLGLMQPQQIDDRILDIGRRDGHRLIADVAMPAILAHGRDAQRILLVALGQRHDRLGHRRRE